MTVKDKIVNYIEENNLLNKLKKFEVTEDFTVVNIYFERNIQHDEYIKQRIYKFSFNGFNHNIIVSLDKYDSIGYPNIEKKYIQILKKYWNI